MDGEDSALAKPLQDPDYQLILTIFEESIPQALAQVGNDKATKIFHDSVPDTLKIP